MSIILFLKNMFQNKSKFKFSPISDDNWWIRFRALNKFISAVHRIIVRVRLLTILALFSTLKFSDLEFTQLDIE